MEQGFGGFLANWTNTDTATSLLIALIGAIIIISLLWVLVGSLAIANTVLGTPFYPRVSASPRRVWALAVLPLFSMFYFQWGYHHAWTADEPRSPRWTEQVVDLSLPLIVPIIIALAIWLKGSRVFAITFGLANLCITYVAAVIASFLITATPPF